MKSKLLLALLSAAVLGTAAGAAACSTERNSGTDDVGGPQHFEKPDNLLNSYLEYELHHEKDTSGNDRTDEQGNPIIDGFTVVGIGQETGETVIIPDTYTNKELFPEYPDGLDVVAIAENAFTPREGNDAAKNVKIFTISQNVEEIGNGAFAGCTALKTITVPNAKLGTGVFANCTELAVVKLDRNLRDIPASTFMNCTSLTAITFPSQVRTIGESAFDGCSGLVSIELGTSVVSIEKRAFAECTRLAEFKTPSGSNLETVGDRAFYGCTNLRRVVLEGNEIAKIGYSCFQQCSKLESITVPFVGYKKYSNINEFNEESNNGDESVYEEFEEENDNGVVQRQSICTSNFGYIFGAKSPEENNTVQYRGRYIPLSLTHVKVAGGVAISRDAFSNCYSITDIEVQGVQFFGEHCFCYCRLESLVLGVATKDIKGDILIYGSLGTLFYNGTETQYKALKIDRECTNRNEVLTSAKTLYYQAAKPTTNKERYWHFNGEVPTPWSEQAKQAEI